MGSGGRWACCLDIGVLEGYHPHALAGTLVATDYGVATVADGTVDLPKGYRASSIAHSDDRE